MSLSIVLNGEEQILDCSENLAALVIAKANNQEGIAVALNSRMIPKSEWSRTEVRDGDRVEIVQAVQGG